MSKWQCIRKHIFAKNELNRHLPDYVSDQEEFYWKFNKPLMLVFSSADQYPAMQSAAFVFDENGAWLEATDDHSLFGALDRVRIFTTDNIPEKWRNRFCRMRFVHSGDCNRVRFEIEDEIVAVIDFSHRRMCCCDGYPAEGLTPAWSKSGHAWDESMLKDFETVPMDADGGPSQLLGPIVSLGRMNFFLILYTLLFPVVTLIVMAVLAAIGFLTVKQAFFSWWGLLIVNRVLMTFFNPVKHIYSGMQLPVELPPPPKILTLRMLRDVVMLGLCAMILFTDIVQHGILMAVLLLVFAIPVVLSNLKARKSSELPKEISAPRLQVDQERLLKATGFFLKRNFPEGSVVLALPVNRWDEETRKAAETLLKEQFSVNNLQITEYDDFDSLALGADVMIPLLLPWRDLRNTQFYQKPPEKRPALFTVNSEPSHLIDICRDIKSGQLAGIIISAYYLYPLDLSPLSPDGSPVEPGSMLPVDSGNVDTLIDIFIKAGYKTFNNLR